MSKLSGFIKMHAKALGVAAIVIVATLQAYWLRNLYQMRRQQLLSRAELIMEKKLFSLGVEALVNNPRETMAATFTNRKIDSLMARVPAGSVLKPAIIIRNDAPTVTAKKLPAFTISGPKVPVEKQWDSLLHAEMRAQMPELVHIRSLIIAHTRSGKGAAYPVGHTINRDANTTGNVSTTLLPGAVFRAQLVGANAIIMKEMAASIGTAVLYLVLFTATVAALAKAAIYQKNLLERQKVFTRNMTHELKIPIATLSIATEALQKGAADNSTKDSERYFAAMQRGIGQLSAITDTILANARLEDGHQYYEKTALPLKSLLEDIRLTLQQQLDARHAMMSTDDIASDCIVYGNKEQIAHALFNLIDNAVKYAKRVPAIRITAHRADTTVRISVADNGPGIPQKYHDTIFEPYFRVADSDTHDVKGYGLGLSFVRQIARAHEGDVFVEKSGPNGTTIILSVPAYGA